MKFYLNCLILLFLFSCRGSFDIANSDFNCKEKIIGEWKNYKYRMSFGKRDIIIDNTFLFRSNILIIKSDTINYSLNEDCSVLKLNTNKNDIAFSVNLMIKDTLILKKRLLPHEQYVLYFKRIN